MPTTDQASRDPKLESDATLIERATAGDAVAAAELDRRGVEPPIAPVPLGPEPIQSFDLAQERELNPAWLREYASSIKLEWGVMEGHIATLNEQIAASADPILVRELRLNRVYAIKAKHALQGAQAALQNLATSLDMRDATMAEQAS